MDTFKLDSSFNKADFIRAQSIKWELHGLKTRNRIKNYAIASMLLLLLGVLSRTDEEPTNPFLNIGLLFFAFTLILAFSLYISKRNYKSKIETLADDFEKRQMDCTYEFSEESIKYWDKEKRLEFNWSVFTSYSIYKDYLVLTLRNSLIESYIFEKKESDIEDYNRILEFAQSKLEFKKIK